MTDKEWEEKLYIKIHEAVVRDNEKLYAENVQLRKLREENKALRILLTLPEQCDRCGKANPAEIHTCTPKQHWSDCAAHSEPAYPAGECDCSGFQPEQEPVAHSVIAGALFDFMGWLTSRKERIVLSSADNASPAVEVITEFAKMRGLSLDDAKVQDWNTTPPQHWSDCAVHSEPAEIHTCTPRESGCDECGKNSSEGWALYCVECSKPMREWIELTDEERLEIIAVGGEAAVLYVTEAKLKEKNT